MAAGRARKLFEPSNFLIGGLRTLEAGQMSKTNLRLLPSVSPSRPRQGAGGRGHVVNPPARGQITHLLQITLIKGLDVGPRSAVDDFIDASPSETILVC